MALTKVTGGTISTTGNYHTNNINSTGIITATKFVGPFEGDVSGIATGANKIKTVDESSDTTCFPVFVNSSTDVYQAAKLGSNLTFNSSTGDLGATKVTAEQFVGNISGTGATFTTGTFTGNLDIGGTLNYTHVTDVYSVGVATFANNVQVGAGISVVGISTLTGIVKIGTNTAGRAGADELTIGNASGDIGITLRSGTSNEGNIYFADSTSSGNAEQRGIIRFDHSTDSLQFFTANGNNWPTEKLRITSAGKILMHGGGATGSNNTATILGNGNTLNIHGTSSSDGISVVRYSANYGAYGINIGKSRDNTFGTNTLVQDGNELGHITFYGADGTNFDAAAQITGVVDGAPATSGDATDMPGALSFRTTPEGSDSPEERLRITSGGEIGINNDDPLYPMHFKNAMGSSPSWIHMEVTGTNTLGGGGGIAFDTSASNATSNNGLFLATISGERSASNNGSNTLVFKTSKAGVDGDDGVEASPKTKMVITEDGSTGIGITNPNWPLTVQRSSGTTTIGCKNTGGDSTVYVEASSGNTAKLTLFQAGTSGYSLQTGSTDALQFYRDSAIHMGLTSGGTLSLGSGNHNLSQVGGEEITGQDYNAIFKIYSTTASRWLMQGRSDTSTNPNGIFIRSGNSSSNYSLYTCGTDESKTHLTVNGKGSVGIGTDEPANKEVPGLHITTSSNDDCRIAFQTPTKPNSRIGYYGLNRFGVDAHGGVEVRDPNISYETLMRMTGDCTFLGSKSANSSDVHQAGNFYMVSGVTQLQGNYNQNTWTPIMRAGHSHNGILFVSMIPGGTAFDQGMRAEVFHMKLTYGYNNGYGTSTTNSQYKFGNYHNNSLGAGVNSMEVEYLNGGTPNYQFRVRGEWAAGLSPAPPKIAWHWIGMNSDYPYPI